MLYHVVDSPVGELLLRSEGEGLCGLDFLDEPFRAPTGWTHAPVEFASWALALASYFEGGRPSFDGALVMRGTEFQKRVWNELQRIPYGVTVSYGEIARRLGDPKAVRAVGLANGRNPIAIIVPCHRVIGADGRLTGYGGGLHRKRALLRLEGVPVDGE